MNRASAKIRAIAEKYGISDADLAVLKDAILKGRGSIYVPAIIEKVDEEFYKDLPIDLGWNGSTLYTMCGIEMPTSMRFGGMSQSDVDRSMRHAVVRTMSTVARHPELRMVMAQIDLGATPLATSAGKAITNWGTTVKDIEPDPELNELDAVLERLDSREASYTDLGLLLNDQRLKI